MSTSFTPKKKRGRPPKPNNLSNKITTTINIAINSLSTSETFSNQSIKQGQPDFFTPLMKVNPKRRKVTPKKATNYNLITPIDNKSNVDYNLKNIDHINGKTLDNLHYVTNGYGYMTPKDDVHMNMNVGGTPTNNHSNLISLHDGENFENLNFRSHSVASSGAGPEPHSAAGINLVGVASSEKPPHAGSVAAGLNLGLGLNSTTNPTHDLLSPLQKFNKKQFQDYKLDTLSIVQNSLTNSLSNLNYPHNQNFNQNLLYNGIGNENGNHQSQISQDINNQHGQQIQLNQLNKHNQQNTHDQNHPARNQPTHNQPNQSAQNYPQLAQNHILSVQNHTTSIQNQSNQLGSNHGVNNHNQLVNYSGQSQLPSTPLSIQRSFSYSHSCQAQSIPMSVESKSNPNFSTKPKSRSFTSASTLIDSDFSLKLMVDESGKAILSGNFPDMKNLDKLDKDNVVDKIIKPKLTHSNTVIGIETMEDVKLSTISESNNNLSTLPQTPNPSKDYFFNTGLTPNSSLSFNLTPQFNSMMYSMMNLQSPKRSIQWTDDFDNNNGAASNTINLNQLKEENIEDSSDARLALQKMIDIKDKD